MPGACIGTWSVLVCLIPVTPSLLMRKILRFPRLAFGLLLCPLLFPFAARAGHYTNFEVSVYIVVGTVRQLAQNPASLSNQWQRITDQLTVDKVYIEAQRDRTLATDAELETVKKFFLDHGVKVAGGTTIFRRQLSRRRAVQVVLLHRSRRPGIHQAGDRTGGAALRRDHPGRFLLCHDQVRFGHRGQGEPELDAIPAGPDG